MTDIDYCTGKNCKQKQICTRFLDYLHRKENNLPYNYPIDGMTGSECPQFNQKESYDC